MDTDSTGSRGHDAAVPVLTPVSASVSGAVGNAVGATHLERGVALVQAVAFAAQPLRLDELVALGGLSRGETAAVLDRLVHGGLVARDERGLFVPGWLLHGLRTDGPDSIEHTELALDDEFAAFVSERLTEEVVAATVRRQHSAHPPGSAPDERAEAGLRLLHDLLLDLEVGVLPDDVTLQLLTRAYAAHPDFRTRWASPAALLRRSPVDPAGPVDPADPVDRVGA